MMTDEPPGVVAASTALYADWLLPATEPNGPWLRRATREPGMIALRARWHYLRGLGQPSDPERHQVSETQWRQEIDLESEGDLALVRHELVVARDRFDRLRAVASHPVPVVEGLIGLGDVARQGDDMASAEHLYQRAAELADECGFEFGAMRARLPLAYLVRRSGSAEQMLDIARECEAVARRLDDRVYVANAQVAQGEALDLLAQRDEAIAVLNEAVEGFAAVRSEVGVAGAGLRLLDVQRRSEDAEAILRTAPRVMQAIEATQQFQEAVDVYDVLAYAYLQQEQFEAARSACRSGIELAGERYPRAAAHLRMTEVVALRKLGRPEEAAQAGLQAYEYFCDRPDDLGTTAHCLGHLADCAEDMGNDDEVVELHLRAMEAVEQIRSRQRKPRWQQEYRQRFDSVYRRAVLAIVRVGDPVAFTAVFESLWGRRLAGVAEGVPLDPDTDPLLIAQLLARNDQARRAGFPRDVERGERRARGLGRVALTGALPDLYADATDPMLAATYRPLQREQGEALLEGTRAESALLLIAEVPGRPGQIAWLARQPHGEPRLGQRELTGTELELIERYSNAWPLEDTAADVAPLATLVPEELRDLPLRTPFQLIPLERLWSMPWAALPVSLGFLGAVPDLLLSPSLSLARSHAGDLGPGCPTGPDTICCIGPGVSHHELRGLGKPATQARTPAAAQRAYQALTQGGTAAVVVLAHGRPVAGLGHYLELALDLILTPTELLNGQPPRSLALLACWGARVLGETTGEPLTLATIALARGSRQVLSTISELGDSPGAAAVVNDTLSVATTRPWPSALSWALRRRAMELRDEPLVDWAALTAIGGW